MKLAILKVLLTAILASLISMGNPSCPQQPPISQEDVQEIYNMKTEDMESEIYYRLAMNLVANKQFDCAGKLVIKALENQGWAQEKFSTIIDEVNDDFDPDNVPEDYEGYYGKRITYYMLPMVNGEYVNIAVHYNNDKNVVDNYTVITPDCTRPFIYIYADFDADGKFFYSEEIDFSEYDEPVVDESENEAPEAPETEAPEEVTPGEENSNEEISNEENSNEEFDISDVLTNEEKEAILKEHEATTAQYLRGKELLEQGNYDEGGKEVIATLKDTEWVKAYFQKEEFIDEDFDVNDETITEGFMAKKAVLYWAQEKDTFAAGISERYISDVDVLDKYVIRSFENGNVENVIFIEYDANGNYIGLN